MMQNVDHFLSSKGTKGLSMFYLETRDESGKLNNMQIVRLKDKLGTRQLPTAELLLDGVVAYKVNKLSRALRFIPFWRM